LEGVAVHPGVFAAKEPDRPAVIMGAAGTVVTYAELEARSNRVAWLARHLADVLTV
jgi:long-chain acyl-CoA synthetase